MTKLLTTLLLLATIAVGTTTAFVTPRVHSSSATNTNAAGSFSSPSQPSLASTTSLSLSSSPENGRSDNHSGGESSFGKARTDIRYFLTQRSIQSFVYLLNQCREEHSVRWLEKTLDFTSIDNFHGTGAFNQTKFPEWDSVFRECVDRPEEVLVMQIRARRRQQRLSGYNAYFESLQQPQPQPQDTDTDPGTPSTDDDSEPGEFAAFNTGTEEPNEQPTEERGIFSATSYLDSMSAPPTAKKPWQPPPKTSQRLSHASSYLEDLGATQSEKEEPSPSKANEMKPSARRTFGPGRSTNYLENLSSASTPPSSSSDDKNKNAKQSNELTKNPYLEEAITEYELSVDPPALVRRILSVREQISKEWVEDLDLLAKLNDEIAEYLEEHNAVAANNEDDEEDDDNDETITSKVENDGDNLLLKSLLASANKEPVPEVSSAVSERNIDEQVDTDTGKRQTSFDRNILSSWKLWSPDGSSSPYRKANFDLLLLLATQESIHRVLKSYNEDDAVRPETHEWLLEYYKDNVNKYFDGHQTFARSEDFLEEMVKSPRTLIETNNEFLAWTDPAIVVEDIVRERSEVTLDWMKIAETISEEHTDLRRMLFTNMVSKPSPDETLVDTIVTAVNIQNITASESSTKVFGAFE